MPSQQRCLFLFTGHAISYGINFKLVLPITKAVLEYTLSTAPAKYVHNSESRSRAMGTFCSQTEHFIQFLKILDLDLSLNYDLGIQILIVIVFTLLLLDGATIKGLIPQKGTMEGYLTAVTKYSINVCGQDITLDPDPRLPQSQWKTHRMLKYIKQYQSKLKGKKNKKDPLTKQMIL